MLRKIYDEALKNGKSYPWLRDLSYGIGARLSGSKQAEQAVIWTKMKLESLHLDTVFLQPVMVPHWVRGDKEELLMISGGQSTRLNMVALGNSVGTNSLPITGKVIEVQSLDELRKLGKDTVSGKIVFFNRPMDPTQISTFNAYRGAVDQRSKGAVEASRLGAIAVLVRSMTLNDDDIPHTGALSYNDSFPKIPAAALSVQAATELSAQLKKLVVTDISLTLSCEMLPEVESYNVVGEIRGSKYPKQYIVVGGHLDSWDTGDGAHDDGAGCVQSMEALRIFKTLDIKPLYSVRVVLYMNEENGLRGGKKYAELAKTNAETHIAAIESDRGGFSPRGFAYEATQKDKYKGLLKFKSCLHLTDYTSLKKAEADRILVR